MQITDNYIYSSIQMKQKKNSFVLQEYRKDPDAL